MAPTTLSERAHTDAVLALLRTTVYAVGDGTRNTGEDGKGTLLPAPCMVLYAVPGGGRSGNLDDWTKDAELVYQVTCIGRTRGECQAVRDATEILLDGLTVPGRHIDKIRPDGASDVRQDTTVGDPVFIATPLYRIVSFPA